MGTTIKLYSGGTYDFANPRVEDIHIEDIAHALALQCRYNGHVPRHYSVAEHSVRVSWLCPPKLMLKALLHDSGEAYCGDITSPLKHMPGFKEPYEQAALSLVARAFSIEGPIEDPEVMRQDKAILAPEGEWRRSNGNLDFGWSADLAEHSFLQRFHQLTEWRYIKW